MGNLVPTNIQIPAHLAGRIGQPSALAQSMSGGIGGGADFPRISIKGARFRIVEGGDETVLDVTSLDVVVVGANPRLSKTWYAKAWSADAEPTAPDCFSLDGVGPANESTLPQNDLCATCPQNAWGSKVTPQGQKIKACADQKRLAVVAADDPSGPIYLLQVTPAALKGLNTYQRELQMRGIAPEIVKTRISFDTDASFPKLQFGFGGFLDAETMAAVDALFGSTEVKAITGEVGAQLAIAAPQAAPAPTVAKPTLVKPAPVAVQEPVPEPVAAEPAAPKRGFGAKAAAPTQAAAPKAAPKVKAQTTVATTTDDLTSQIENMIADIGSDDA